MEMEAPEGRGVKIAVAPSTLSPLGSNTFPWIEPRDDVNDCPYARDESDQVATIQDRLKVEITARKRQSFRLKIFCIRFHSFYYFSYLLDFGGELFSLSCAASRPFQ